MTKEMVMKSLKQCILALSILMVVLIISAGRVSAITIELINNGNFEEGGGSLTGWNIKGDVGLITDNFNHLARIGESATSGTSLMTQLFNIKPGYGDQTLSFDYAFSYNDSSASFFDVFATYVTEDPDTLQIVETPLLLASYDTTGWAQTIGQHTNVLDQQLNPGWYYLKFKLTESNGTIVDSYLDIDNISLTVTTTAVPEPSTLILMGSFLIGFAAIGKRLRKMA